MHRRKKPFYYRLEADNSITPMSQEEYFEYTRTGGDVTTNLRRTTLQNKEGTLTAEVSTIFMFLDHSFMSDKPVCFESMVFGGKMDNEGKRYCTYDEAMKGHALLVEQVKRSFEEEVLPVECLLNSEENCEVCGNIEGVCRC